MLRVTTLFSALELPQFRYDRTPERQSDKKTMSNEHARFVFKGTFRGQSFGEFARHRAERLGLDLQLGQASAEAVALNVSGAAELVDAFEMACSLGPFDCLVRDVVRQDIDLAA
jgi:hypothetical protein